MTKKQLITIREATYQEPTGQRCGTCKHRAISVCCAISVRGKLAKFRVHEFGVCALWTERAKGAEGNE